MILVLRRRLTNGPLFSCPTPRSFSRSFCTAEAQEDTLVWPPPEMEGNLALQRLVQAQRSLKRREEAAPPRPGAPATDNNTAQRQQGSSRGQSAAKDTGAAAAAASKPAGRMAELVKGLLAERSIVRPVLDRDSIEKLRVIDLRQVLAAMGLPRTGLKASLVDRAWDAAKQELAGEWRTDSSRFPSGQASAAVLSTSMTSDEQALQADMPYSRVVTGDEVAAMLNDAKADDVRVLDVRPRQCDFTDEMVVATARSKLHCQSLAQAVVYRLKQSCKEIAPGIPPRIEGMGISHHANADWLVVDCGSVVAHIFDGQETRMQYDLESLWGGTDSHLGGSQLMQSML